MTRLGFASTTARVAMLASRPLIRGHVGWQSLWNPRPMLVTLLGETTRLVALEG